MQAAQRLVTAPGVEVDGEVMPADAVVVAMGPWSGQAAKWGLPVPVVCCWLASAGPLDLAAMQAAVPFACVSLLMV